MYDVPVLVKDALRSGAYKKNYRMVVLATDTLEEFTIDNNNLVKESVHIDERMVSGDTLKFGLCEGSSLEFQYFDKENITGRQLQCFIDVDYDNMGWNAVKTLTNADNTYICDYDTRYRIILPSYSDLSVSITHDGQTETTQYISMITTEPVDLGTLSVGDEISLSANYDFEIELQKDFIAYTIPMGFFTVSKCSRQASTGIMKVTAYNKLMSDYLDAKANDFIDNDIENEDFTGSMSLYSLLNKMLEGFSIDSSTYELRRTWQRTTPWSNPGYEPAITPSNLYDANGQYLPLFLHVSYAREVFFEGTATPDYVAIEASDFVKSKTMQLWEDFFEEYPEAESYKIPLSQNPLVLVNLKDCIDTSLYDEARTFDTLYYKGGFEWVRRQSIQPYELNFPNYGLNSMSDFHYTDMIFPVMDFPTGIWIADSIDLDYTKAQTKMLSWSTDLINNGNGVYAYSFTKVLTPMEKYRVTENDFASEVTLRELQSAVFETACQYGQLDRQTDLFSGVELNQSRLFPQDTLYPAANLHPHGAAISGAKSMYEKLWADEGNIHKWKYLIITYKGLDGEGNEVDKTLQRTINADGTDNYNMSDNWLFRNLVWAAEDVGTYADAMVAKMQDMTWFPFEMWAAGLPYLETGDEIEIPLGEETYTSYILQRQLKGIQNLQDTYINGTLDIF